MNTSSTIQLLREKAKKAVLYEVIFGTYPLSPVDNDRLPHDELVLMDLVADSYQVVTYEDFHGTATPMYHLSELLWVDSADIHLYEQLTVGRHEVVLLKGSSALRRFERFLTHYGQEPQEGSPAYSLFLTYGPPVTDLDEVCHSYNVALTLSNRRFFCPQKKHVLGYHEMQLTGDEITTERLDEFLGLLTVAIKTFNHRKVAKTMDEMEVYLRNVNDNVVAVKHFLMDLFFQIKEDINQTYHSAELLFSPNSEIIDTIEKSHCLHEIICFISEQADLVIDMTGHPSRDAVLDDVLHYINHNYQSNIKLETMAPLFGYNSDYLGKIFTRSIGENFNSYIDNCRIKHAKTLLVESNLKVYEIAERVGYRNVDYFHKKFKKYVGMSPIEYRKMLCPTRTQIL